MSLYKIDDVAKECGLTKRTIRYYEEIGVMPSPQRTDGGTRLYTREDIDYLKGGSRQRGTWILPSGVTYLCGNSRCLERTTF